MFLHHSVLTNKGFADILFSNLECSCLSSPHDEFRYYFLALQSLLRGLLPDSFPARLAAEPGTEKQRRFIIIDENVFDTYGPQLEQVCIFKPLHSFP